MKTQGLTRQPFRNSARNAEMFVALFRDFAGDRAQSQSPPIPSIPAGFMLSERALFGSDLEALVQNRVLVPTRLDSVPHPAHPDAGHALTAHLRSDGDFDGVSQVPGITSHFPKAIRALWPQ